MANENDIMFSVEVLTYNQRKYIAQTLQSIIDQKHNYKYEILVSDDCSTDGTQDIIKEYSKKYPHIIKPVYNEKNLGAMSNYYATIARAKGKYLMECGGDDYWLPGKVQKQIEFMEHNPDFGLCYSRAQNLYEETGCSDGYVGHCYIDKNDILLKGNCVASLTCCVRMDLFRKYLEEIQPQTRNWLMEDYPLNVYSFYESYVYYFSEPLGVYRVIKGSVCHQIAPDKQFNFEKSIYNIRIFFADRYSIKIEELSDLDIFNKIKSSYFVNKKDLDLLRKKINLPKDYILPFVFLKKILRYLLPYGLIIFYRKMKEKK